MDRIWVPSANESTVVSAAQLSPSNRSEIIDQLRRRMILALLAFSIVIIPVITILPAIGLEIIDTTGRNLSTDLLLGLVGLAIFISAFGRVRNLKVLSSLDRLLFAGLPCLLSVVVVQFNGTLPLAMLAVPWLFLLGLYAPQRLIVPLSLIYVAMLYVLQHYTTEGLHEHAVDARVFQSLVTLIWPMHTLATSNQPFDELRATLAKQLMLVTVASSFWWLFDPTFGKNGIVSGGLAIVLWVWMRKAEVLTLAQRVAVLVALVGAYSVAVLNHNSLPLHVIAGWLLLIFCVLPRLWATFLSGLMILFASVGFDIGDALVLRGVISALFVLMIFNLWFAALGRDFKEAIDKPSLLIALGFSGANLLLDQLPYLAGHHDESLTAETLLTDLLHFGVVTWLAYEFLMYLKRSQSAKSEAEAEMRQRESALVTAADMSGVGLYQANLHSKRFYANRQFYEIHGFEPGTKVSFDKVMALVPISERDSVRAKILQHKGSYVPLELEHKLDVKDKLIDVQVRISRHKDNSGDQVLIAVRDITEEKRRVESLQSATARFELALNVAGLAMFELDVASERITLISGPHFLSKRFDDYTIAGLAEKYIPAAHERTQFLDACRSENRSAEYEVLDPVSGESSWARVRSGETYQRGGESKRLIVRLDITEERKSIRSLREAQEHQRELFAIIGHELRTPVAGIDMTVSDPDMSAEEKVRITAELADSLLHILDDLRTVVSPERAMQAREIDANPATVCERAVTVMLPIAAERGVELQFRSDQTAMRNYLIRHQALRQIVTNLVKNALLHARAKTVEVSLGAADDSAGKQCLLLVVEDDGVGIPESERETVFKKFSRGTTSEDGSGLGLYIVTELAKMLQGTLKYEARSEGGSRFAFEFPARLSLSSAEETSVAGGYNLEGKRVLVAEDDKLIRMLTEKVLLNAQAKVVLAEQGQEAAALFAGSKFDFVLTDIMMPVMDGYELCQTLRERGYTGPIIGITAAVVGTETDRLIEAGANAVLSKPIKIDKLVSTLAELQKLSSETEKGA